MINRSRLVKLTQKLLQIDSVNPPGNELEISNFIAKDMRSLGLEVKCVSYQKDRPNVITTLKGTWPRAKAKKEAMLITPHIDTVPFGSGWKFNPIGGQIHQGRIYGRGASDDKGNCACGMEVMRSLVEDGVRLKRDIIFAATVDEETGSQKGIVPLLEKGVLRPKVALITDSEEFDSIICQKGLLHSRVQIFGKKAHGAYNWRGVNAIEIAARVINRLKNFEFKYRPHKILRPPTINIGTIKGGDKVNMVADFCEFSVDCRYLPGMKAGNIVREFKAMVAKETKDFKWIIDDSQLPYEIDAAHPFVKTYVDTVSRMGYKAAVKGSEGATVITFFQKYGIPAFSTGYGTHGTIHANDEFAEIDILFNGSRALEQFLKDYDAKC